jgi:hypothetical protein
VPGSLPPSLEPGVTPTLAPIITLPPPAATPIKTPPPTPTPTPKPTAPIAKLQIQSIGLEDPNSTAAKIRTIDFVSEGPGQVSVAVSHVITPPDKVELCLQRETRTPFCRVSSHITLFGTTTMAHTQWHVTLKGTHSGTISSAWLDLAFPATKPLVRGRSFYISGPMTYHGIVIDLIPSVTCLVGSAYPNLTATTVSPTRGFKDLTDPSAPLAAPTSPACPSVTDLGPDGTTNGIYYTGTAGHTLQFTYVDNTSGDDAWVDFLIAWSNPPAH